MPVGYVSWDDLPNYLGLDAGLIEILIAARVFPAPILRRRGGRPSWWLQSEVDGWHERRAFERSTVVIDISKCELVEAKIFKGRNAIVDARRYLNDRRA